MKRTKYQFAVMIDNSASYCKSNLPCKKRPFIFIFELFWLRTGVKQTCKKIDLTWDMASERDIFRAWQLHPHNWYYCCDTNMFLSCPVTCLNSSPFNVNFKRLQDQAVRTVVSTEANTHNVFFLLFQSCIVLCNFILQFYIFDQIKLTLVRLI